MRVTVGGRLSNWARWACELGCELVSLLTASFHLILEYLTELIKIHQVCNWSIRCAHRRSMTIQFGTGVGHHRIDNNTTNQPSISPSSISPSSISPSSNCNILAVNEKIRSSVVRAWLWHLSRGGGGSAPRPLWPYQYPTLRCCGSVDCCRKGRANRQVPEES